MASIVNYVADGATNQFQIPFTYINQADVVVTVNGTTPTFTFVNSTSINISTTPASGAKVIIKRVTPLNALVDFTDGSTLFEADLDLAHQQNRLIAEESRDRADSAIATINANITNIETVAEIASNVNIVAGNTTNVNSVATNMAEVLNADTNAATATTKAGEASASAATASAQATISTTKAGESSTSAAEALASKNAASASESASSTSEANSANSATSSANSASASGSSASSASSSQTVATTKAAEAVVSANNSAVSATNSANSATTATTKANEASASQSAAATSEANALSSKNAAASSAINAATSETNAATSKTNAEASASTATTKASEASTSAATATTKANESASSATASASSATSAANSASTATTKASEASSSAATALSHRNDAQTAKTAAETAETNAEAAESNVAASATAVSNSASSASTSASTATTKASEASTSAATATTKANEAATSASNASTAASTATTKASEASASATNAASSATAASASKDAALAALDSFDDRYLGVKSSNPSVDNDGNALVAGSLYFNSTDDTMKVYEGSAWVAAYSSLSGALLTANNLSDVSDVTASRTNIGLGTGDSPTFTGITAASGDVDLDTLDLNAIAASKGDTAVDVFVYDTSKDSDGGAWRKRTQGTSWYNETLNTATRGSRKEFPAVAVIVAESNKVTIYDGDDPDLPMWMVFNNSGLVAYTVSLTSLSMINGVLSFGGTSGFFTVKFLSEIMRLQQGGNDRWQFNISSRNTAALVINGLASYLVNDIVNDVAMTVLPNAPVDAATGLAVPTIAVATDGGVSVIKDDGTVVDDTATAYSNNEAGYITFLNDKRLAFGTRNSNMYTRITDIPTSDNSSLKATDVIIWSKGSFLSTTAIDVQQATPSNRSGHTYNKQTGTLAFGTEGKGLSLVKPDYIGTSDDEHFAAHIDSTYNTGWMNGDIKLATLSDTDDTDAVGSELVTNGDFASDIASWTDVSTGTGSLAWNASGHMDLIAVGLSNRAKVYQGFSTVIGKTYTINYTLGGTANHDVLLGSTAQSSNIVGDAGGTNGTHSYTFVAISTTTYVTFSEAGTTTATVDDVSCRLADPDRSVNDNGLQVFGTVTKNPVATGSDLVGYGGFSTSNYLEQPYNSDLDFGTGDFCLMGWAKFTGTGVQFIAYRGTSTVSQTSFDCYIDTSYNMHFRTSTKTTTASSFFTPNSWAFVTCLRRNGVGYIYRNGELVSTNSDFAESVTVANAITRLGSRADYPSTYGSLALWRISATAPSAEQIAKIYNDEKVLFQENAKATLYGSSDAVTALAHDDATDLLHAGTSAGRSVFQGLRRVSNTTTAVGTAISASNGLVVEE